MQNKKRKGGPPAEKPKPGTRVILTEVPPGLPGGLPIKDQQAIFEAVGRTILLNEYDEDGRAELEFTDSEGTIHFIYVNPDYIRSEE